jgi:ferrous iron transport protein B
MANSPEEEIARDFLCFGAPDAVVIVADATCLERNLNLVLQTMELTPQVILCVNLMDEAKSRSIRIDLQRLAHCLGIPVVGTAARSGRGLNCLMDEVARLTAGDPGASPLRFTYPEEIEQAIKLIEPVVEKFKKGTVPARWIALSLLYADARFLHSIEQFLIADLSKNRELTDCVSRAADFLKQRGIEPDSLRDRVVSRIITLCEEIGQKAVAVEKTHSAERDRKIDRILTARSTGIPLMLALLFIIFWLTISGANYPSGLLADGLFWIEGILEKFLVLLSAPDWLIGVLAYGIYRTLAWVISVMLPPMAIFFPLFTLLEDLGYLPRIAFNLDNLFRKACAHGKQALTMCMGFGCNAAGVIGCRIIDTPRERLIAILTNSLVPCNGKFPTLIAIITMFFAGAQGGVLQSVTATVLLTFVILLGVAMTFLLSRLLSKTV